jgi:hypothetical protein
MSTTETISECDKRQPTPCRVATATKIGDSVVKKMHLRSEDFVVSLQARAMAMGSKRTSKPSDAKACSINVREAVLCKDQERS